MLDNYRKEIDAIDAQLAELLESRIEVARKIGLYKGERGMAVTDAAREEKVLEQVASRIKNAENKPYITRLWRLIMEMGRNTQLKGRRATDSGETPLVGDLIKKARTTAADPTVLFQGIEGSNSHEASVAYFGKDVRAAGITTFEKVCRAVLDGDADYGVLPFENNTTGPVARVRELIDRYGLYITGEQNVRCEHCLLGQRGASLANIKEVYSHEQALLQCASFLESHGDIRGVAGLNTAVCARDVAAGGDMHKAAIASSFTADLYGLDVLRVAINDNPNNCTRFVVVSKYPELAPGRDKVSLLFTVHHRTGALHRVLSIFADYNLNMTKLESIPLGGADFEYLFIADFIGDITQNNTQKALALMFDECSRVRLLGNYKNKRRNIVLTGMPGSGKNAIGKALSARVGMGYVDTDELIERREGRSVSEIFAARGETAFRDLESEVAAEAASMGGLVISTGGGTMMRRENARALRRTGLVFFINRPVSEILSSVDLSDRPLLASEPERIHKLYSDRLPVYRSTADHEVVNDGELTYAVETMDNLIYYLKGGNYTQG